jgi:hypothetical protein
VWSVPGLIAAFLFLAMVMRSRAPSKTGEIAAPRQW